MSAFRTAGWSDKDRAAYLHFSKPLAAARRLALGAAILALVCGRSIAADLPVLDPAARLQDELRRADNAAPQLPAAPRATPAAPPPVPEAPTLASTVLLNEVLFSPSELLGDDELRALAQPYLGRDVSSQDLNAFLRAIQTLYLSKGVTTAVPVLPQQDLRSGTLRVLLVEGRLGAVKVEGASGIDPAWVGQWFDLAAGSVIRPEELERRLGVFNVASDFAAQAAYVPGAEFGRSDLLVHVPERSKEQLWGLVDMPDTGSSARSSVIAGLRLLPLGLRGGRFDVMAIAGSNAATLSLSGSLPLGHQGWRLGASASGSRSRTSFASSVPGVPDLVIHGASSSVAVEVGRHVPVSARQLLLLSGSATQIKSRSTISGFELSDRTVDKLTLTASTDWPAREPGEVSPASLRASVTTARGPVNSYSFAEVAGMFAQRLGASGPLFRINGQARLTAHDTPDVIDAWLAGGSNSVRGFDSGTAMGERGYAVQMALYQPVTVPGLEATELYVFADHARVYSKGWSRRIASAGAGVQFQVNRHLAVDATLAQQTAGFQGDRTRLSLRASASW
ncbi:POTRA domain-containing protein [Hydrogenophaga sp. BPS33]|uniref:POTRA domain-containing protein n=1 Tax=Hydrogenophaga sp. BPS33 TaxID=2651974 RepID=UPI0013203366|nr:POTRA domain-containing protein [Hydrogenophaga sp. BPS33]QHE87195.1 ShlB/FhaC/HecB family hemolysin secretion/activation protein [Hydrogenophaga sp. BPS33]